MLQSEYNKPPASIEQRLNVILLFDLQLAAHSYAFVCGASECIFMHTNKCLSASDKCLNQVFVSIAMEVRLCLLLLKYHLF